MSALSYDPADEGLLVIAAEGAVLVIDDASIAVEPLWSALRGRDAVADVMAQLTSGGLAATPAFALLVPDAAGGARLVVRGPLVAEVADAAGGGAAIDASAVLTWAEHLLAEAVRVTIRRADGAAPRSAAAALPLASGAARADRVVLQIVPADPASAEAAALDRTVVVPHLQREVGRAGAGTPADEPGSQPEAASEPDAESAPQPAPAPADSVEHDDLHSTRAPESTIVPAPPAAPAVPAPPAASPAAPPAAPPAPSPGGAGDHDGLTVVAGDLAAMRSAAGATATTVGPRYVLDISSGGSAALDGSIIVGRAPSTSRVSDGRIPQLVGLPGADDISRNHVRFDLEGDSVVVTDLHSRNGTVLRAPGASPRQLRAGESSVVLGGTVVDLGGITLTVREG